MPNLTYSSYFDRLPNIRYDINHTKIGAKYETVTNIFFRVRVIQEVLDNINSYYVVEIEDGETPEILAEKAYGDPGGNWVITIANNIIDPQWEWPLNYDEFQNYIIGKYGSIANAKTTVHHYEMVVTRTIQPDNITTEHRYTVNKEKLTNNNLVVPYNYYLPHVSEDFDEGTTELQPGSLATHEFYNAYNIGGKTIIETINGSYVDCYDYEESVNEQRRLIKVIKQQYYGQIQSEFTKLTGGAKTPTSRIVR